MSGDKPYRRDRQDIITMVIRSEHVDKEMVDRRMAKKAQALGTVREGLGQYGLSMRVKGSLAYIKGPRSRMQLFLEKVHYSGMPYRLEGNKL